MSSQSINMTNTNPNPSSLPFSQLTIPPQLKFIMSSIKSVITTQLSPENHPTWKAQVLKLFSANGVDSFLLGTISPPSQYVTQPDGTLQANPDHALWHLMDQNLTAALYSTISPALLPHVLNLNTTHDIWQTVEHRLQPTNRSRISQLKNDLYTISMKDLSMQQYLTLIKTKVDALAAAGSKLDTEDIIHYTLNGLSSQYHSFKSAIRTNLQPLRLDDFYSLLCSEETNLAVEAQRDLLTATHTTTALYSNRGRGRGLPYRGRSAPNTSNRQVPSQRTRDSPASPAPSCQICHKRGHTADRCWHRSNLSYQPAPQYAMHTGSSNSQPEWLFDTGATSHLTPDPTLLHNPQPYLGNNTITVGNGTSVPITHIGQGLLPTPTRKLHLSPLLHSPQLSHHLLSVHKLAADNNCTFHFAKSGYTVTDNSSNNIILHGASKCGLYPLRFSPTALTATCQPNSIWHLRLGHPQLSTF